MLLNCFFDEFPSETSTMGEDDLVSYRQSTNRTGGKKRPASSPLQQTTNQDFDEPVDSKDGVNFKYQSS